MVQATLTLRICMRTTDLRSSIYNDTEVMKTLTFFNNGSWSISITGTEIMFSKLSIDNKYYLNKDCILFVCNIAKKLKLCHGIILSKSVITTRFHIIEQWKTYKSTDCSRILRSLLCHEVVQFTNQCNSCIVCQKLLSQARNPK